MGMVATSTLEVEISKKGDENDSQTKKDKSTITATNTVMLQCNDRKHNGGWSTMVVLFPNSSTKER